MLLIEENLTEERVEWLVDTPLVTFICCTFKEESYVDEALKGFCSQKTKFPFDVIIQNDSSTDSTKFT